MAFAIACRGCGDPLVLLSQLPKNVSENRLISCSLESCQAFGNYSFRPIDEGVLKEVCQSVSAVFRQHLDDLNQIYHKRLHDVSPWERQSHFLDEIKQYPRSAKTLPQLKRLIQEVENELKSTRKILKESAHPPVGGESDDMKGRRLELHYQASQTLCELGAVSEQLRKELKEAQTAKNARPDTFLYRFNFKPETLENYARDLESFQAAEGKLEEIQFATALKIKTRYQSISTVEAYAHTHMARFMLPLISHENSSLFQEWRGLKSYLPSQILLLVAETPAPCLQELVDTPHEAFLNLLQMRYQDVTSSAAYPCQTISEMFSIAVSNIVEFVEKRLFKIFLSNAAKKFNEREEKFKSRYFDPNLNFYSNTRIKRVLEEGVKKFNLNELNDFTRSAQLIYLNYLLMNESALVMDPRAASQEAARLVKDKLLNLFIIFDREAMSTLNEILKKIEVERIRADHIVANAKSKERALFFERNLPILHAQEGTYVVNVVVTSCNWETTMLLTEVIDNTLPPDRLQSSSASLIGRDSALSITSPGLAAFSSSDLVMIACQEKEADTRPPSPEIFDDSAAAEIVMPASLKFLSSQSLEVASQLSAMGCIVEGDEESEEIDFDISSVRRVSSMNPQLRRSRSYQSQLQLLESSRPDSAVESTPSLCDGHSLATSLTRLYTPDERESRFAWLSVNAYHNKKPARTAEKEQEMTTFREETRTFLYHHSFVPMKIKGESIYIKSNSRRQSNEGVPTELGNSLVAKYIKSPELDREWQIKSRLGQIDIRPYRKKVEVLQQQKARPLQAIIEAYAQSKLSQGGAFLETPFTH